ncbi:hypothetical protein ACET3Z_029965 [Daucus carota]
MDGNVSWDNLPSELLEVIGQKMVGSCEDFIRFSAVSKSWQSVAFKMRQDGSTFLLSPESPLLVLAEDVPEGYILRCCDINVDEDGLEEASDDEDLEEDEEENEDEEGLQEEEDQEEDFADEEGDDDDDEEMEDLEEKEFIFSVGTARGIYSLSTEKIYTLELPEAAGKSIRGTNKGWLLTLGINSETKLLHPLLGHQIWLPYLSICSKVTLSSRVLQDPTIMVIHGGSLGFARFGDQEWKKVESPSVVPFVDITYHKGKFYAINHVGAIFACNIDDGYTSGATGAPITSCPFNPVDFGSKYLVDSENDLWFLARIRGVKFFKPPHNMRVKYRTTHFSVWRLEPTVSEDGHETISTWVQKHDLGGKAFFVGLNASVSLSSSGWVRPNCIYFTDDINEDGLEEDPNDDKDVKEKYEDEDEENEAEEGEEEGEEEDEDRRKVMMNDDDFDQLILSVGSARGLYIYH